METDPLDDIFGPEGAAEPAPAESPQAPAETPQAPAETPVGGNDQGRLDSEDFWASVPEAPEFEGNPFVTKEEKQVALDEGWIFTASAVRDADTEVGPTWFVDVIIPNGELRTLTFKNGQGIFSRDHYLEHARAWFDSHPGGRIQFQLSKSGRAWVLVAPGAAS